MNGVVGGFVVAMTVTFGFEYRRDSRLLVTNPKAAVEESLRFFGGCPGKENEWAVTSHFYEWTGHEFRHLTDWNACGGEMLPNKPLQPTPAAGPNEQPDTAGAARAAERRR